MDALTWSDRFLTGMEGVDDQHHRLVDMINAFGELCSRHAEVPRAELEAVIDELERYTRTHFTDEEALMKRSGIDARFVLTHQRLHGQFLHEVRNMRAADFLGAPETSRVVLRFLLHWLAFHILGTDMQLARQLERVARGESSQDAFAAEVREVEGPAQLLLGALDDLMRVVAQRNTELTEANRTLEARVASRTSELQAANEQLTKTVATLRSTQANLVTTEKLASVGQLASGMAHEINNPLAFISANVSSFEAHAQSLLTVVDCALQLAPGMPAPMRAQLDRACTEADVDFVREDLGQLVSETKEGLRRVQDIVRDLKDFSHVEGGAFSEVDLKGCIESTLKVFPNDRRTGITFTTQFEPMGKVRCQAGPVKQAVLNLLLNATQAIHAKPERTGTITVRTGVEADGGFIEVADSGVGMSPEVVARACEPFFTTRAPGKGTGLGLTTVYNCAQAHTGRLDINSEPGVGSTFRLWLPFEGLRAEQVPVVRGNDFNTRRYSDSGLRKLEEAR